MQRGHITERMYPNWIDKEKYMLESLNKGGDMCKGNIMKGKVMQRRSDEREIHPEKSPK